MLIYLVSPIRFCYLSVILLITKVTYQLLVFALNAKLHKIAKNKKKQKKNKKKLVHGGNTNFFGKKSSILKYIFGLIPGKFKYIFHTKIQVQS